MSDWLDGLLGEAEEHIAKEKAEKEKVRQARKKAKAAKRKGATPAPVARPFREQRWTPVALVGVFARQHCRCCGTNHYTAAQSHNLFVRYHRKHVEYNDSVRDRLLKDHVPTSPDVWEIPVEDCLIAPSVYHSLPREKRVLDVVLAVCGNCWQDKPAPVRTYPLPLHFRDVPALPEPADVPEPTINLDDLFSKKERIICK